MHVPNYTDAQVPAVMQSFVADKQVLGLFARLFYGDWHSLSAKAQQERIANHMVPKLLAIQSLDQFQKEIFYDFFVKSVIDNTIDTLEVSGFEHLDPSKRYLFVSNHRDIVLDPLLFNYGLLQHTSLTHARLVFGDNLLISPQVAAIFGMNRGLVVCRSGSLREMFDASKRLSADIFHTIQDTTSVWIAQRGGRAKDGRDITEPAVLKMFHMVSKETGLSFQQFLEKCPIVPLSISYEIDVCDRMKSWELYRYMRDEKKDKRQFADLASVIAGVRMHKGKVALRVGTPISSDITTVKDAAWAIDQQIQGNYKLWKNNYIAHDITYKARFQDKYTAEDKARFLHRFTGLPEGVRKIAIESYSNPLLLHHAAVGKEL